MCQPNVYMTSLHVTSFLPLCLHTGYDQVLEMAKALSCAKMRAA